MKCEKNGFTFIELMFVMVLLALMVIIAYPYILNSYLKAQKDTFLIEAKDIYKKAETKYASELVKGKKISVITDSSENSLDYGEGVIKYCVNLSNDGKVTGIKVAKGDYYLEGDNNFLTTAVFETIKYGEFFEKFNCDYVFDESDIRIEPTLKEIKADEKYLNTFKYLGIAFIVVVIIGLITSNKNRRTTA